VVFLLLFLFGIGLGPGGGDFPHYIENTAKQATRTIVLSMFQYANDHDGKYPDGASSTEVFQKLLDENYLTDPAIFFVPLPGKVAAKMGAKLKPENVAYDVTSGIDANSPDTVPVVFLTGFRMDYRAGAPAVSLLKPFPKYHVPPNTWFIWSWQPFGSWLSFDGLPAAYHSNNAYFRSSYPMGPTEFPPEGHPTQYTPDGYGIVPDVIAPEIDLHGKTYRQLTPDGVLK
jgi:hypothetical protein